MLYAALIVGSGLFAKILAVLTFMMLTKSFEKGLLIAVALCLGCFGLKLFLSGVRLATR